MKCPTDVELKVLRVWIESLNNDGHQFDQYEQDEQ
jgi:hypothetical protein